MHLTLAVVMLDIYEQMLLTFMPFQIFCLDHLNRC